MLRWAPFPQFGEGVAGIPNAEERSLGMKAKKSNRVIAFILICLAACSSVTHTSISQCRCSIKPETECCDIDYAGAAFSGKHTCGCVQTQPSEQKSVDITARLNIHRIVSERSSVIHGYISDIHRFSPMNECPVRRAQASISGPPLAAHISSTILRI